MVSTSIVIESFVGYSSWADISGHIQSVRHLSRIFCLRVSVENIILISENVTLIRYNSDMSGFIYCLAFSLEALNILLYI